MKTRPALKVNLVASALTALLLAFLFIFPHRILDRLVLDITAMCDALERAVLNEDYALAGEIAEQMESRFLSDSKRLRLFLDHEDVDNLEGIFSSMRTIVPVNEQVDLMLEASKVRNMLDYLAGIEHFTLINLF